MAGIPRSKHSRSWGQLLDNFFFEWAIEISPCLSRVTFRSMQDVINKASAAIPDIVKGKLAKLMAGSSISPSAERNPTPRGCHLLSFFFFAACRQLTHSPQLASRLVDDSPRPRVTGGISPSPFRSGSAGPSKPAQISFRRESSGSDPRAKLEPSSTSSSSSSTQSQNPRYKTKLCEVKSPPHRVRFLECPPSHVRCNRNSKPMGTVRTRRGVFLPMERLNSAPRFPQFPINLPPRPSPRRPLIPSTRLSFAESLWKLENVPLAIAVYLPTEIRSSAKDRDRDRDRDKRCQALPIHPFRHHQDLVVVARILP